MAWLYTSLPLRATMITTPGMSPASTAFLNTAVIRSRRWDDMPTCSGVASGSGAARADVGGAEQRGEYEAQGAGTN